MQHSLRKQKRLMSALRFLEKSSVPEDALRDRLKQHFRTCPILEMDALIHCLEREKMVKTVGGRVHLSGQGSLRLDQLQKHFLRPSVERTDKTIESVLSKCVATIRSASHPLTNARLKELHPQADTHVFRKLNKHDKVRTVRHPVSGLTAYAWKE